MFRNPPYFKDISSFNIIVRLYNKIANTEKNV